MEFVKIETTGFQAICNKLKESEEDNEVLRKELEYYKKYAVELEKEINDMKATRKYLTAKDAGKRFAEELLGA